MSKISYCSLEEAWGDDFVKLKKEKYNEEVENNKTEYNPQLMPLNSSNEINNIQGNQSNQINQNSKINNNLDTYNNINQEIVDTSNRLNVLDIVNSNSKTVENKNVNNDILSEMIESFQNNKQDEIKEHFGNYKTDIFELIILIIIGLIIIFVLDSVYKIGKSVGLKMRV
jgi:hypothetical protein